MGSKTRQIARHRIEPSAPMVPITPAGEALVPVKKLISQLPDGSTQVQAQLSALNLPVPLRRYSAEVADARQVRGSFRLLFGQLRLDEKRLRSLIVLRISPEAMAKFVDSCSSFTPAVEKHLKEQGVESERLHPFVDEPETCVSLEANIVLGAFSGSEAVLDFYHISPAAHRQVSTYDFKEIAVDPVVRVHMPTTLLAALLDRLGELDREPDRLAGGNKT